MTSVKMGEWNPQEYGGRPARLLCHPRVLRRSRSGGTCLLRAQSVMTCLPTSSLWVVGGARTHTGFVP